VASSRRCDRRASSARTRLVSILIFVACTSLSSVSLTGRAQACSQCMCGTPFPAGVLGGVVPKQVTYGFEERYLSKTSALDDGPGLEEEREHRVAGYAMWRPLNRLALLGRLPWNVKQVTELPGTESLGTQTSHGLGDAELTVLAGVLRGGGWHALTLGLVLGGTAPTGSNDVRDASGQRLDIHLQPGTGAWSGTTGRLVVAVNYGDTRAQCYIRLAFPDLRGACVLRDLVNPGIEYERDGGELATRGLYLDLGPWGHHVFELSCMGLAAAPATR